jgi:AraC-like DNA-binding protein
LSIVSVGGTMNIITKGIDQKMGVSVKQEVNNYGLYKTSFGYNTGMLKGKWGITLGGSRKWGDSYANATFDDAWSYFFKIQKRFNKQTLTFGVNGAPQSHGQRTTRLPISVISQDLADQLGYYDSAHFINEFKKYTGKTPKSLKNSLFDMKESEFIDEFKQYISPEHLLHYTSIFRKNS